MHDVMAVAILLASVDASLHAVCNPLGRRVAAAKAAKSAAACARCRAITAEPTYPAPTVTASRTVMLVAATMLAEPRSRPRWLCQRGRLRGDRDTRQDHGGADPRDDEVAVPARLEHRTLGRDAARRRCGSRVITPSRQPRRLPGGVDTPNLHRHGGDTSDAQHQHRDQSRDRERRLDGDPTGVYTLVLSARWMMFVNAPMIESPVTTV